MAKDAPKYPSYYPRSYRKIAEAADREKNLVIYSSTDYREFADILSSFKARHPDIKVDYADLASWEVYRRFLADVGARRPGPDLVINSAMDLQIKLVNDGYAQPYASPEKPYLPDWAAWKNEAYGITAEPIVFAYNKRLMPPGDVPRTHEDVAVLLNRKAAAYRGKVASYSPELSGTGFLTITQDVQLNHDTWNIIRALGRVKAHFYISSEEMIAKISAGEHIFAYNIIGSYALSRQAVDPSVGVVLPEDYTLVMSRIALIAKDAPHPAAAKLFLDHILSRQGQSLLARRHMNPVRTDSTAPQSDRSRLRAIRVGPALLASLDQMKRAKFLKDWRRALGTDERRRVG